MADIDKEVEQAIERVLNKAMPSVVEEMQLDLTKAEKLRTVALYMAITYHVQTIVKDGQLYQAMVNRGEQLTPTEAEKVVRQAVLFEQFIVGKLSPPTDAIDAAPAPAEEGGEQ